MNEPKSKYHIHVGQRNIKTAFAATICAFLYFLVDQNPTFACIGAIFGIGSDMGNSRLNGGNRFFGTIIGGILGMGLFRLYICFYPDGSYHWLMLLLLFIGVIILIIASLLFRWPGAIQPGGVILCIILFNTPVDSYISYSINRIIDTGIGVAVALLINWIFSKERVDRWIDFVKVKRSSGDSGEDLSENASNGIVSDDEKTDIVEADCGNSKVEPQISLSVENTSQENI